MLYDSNVSSPPGPVGSYMQQQDLIQEKFEEYDRRNDRTLNKMDLFKLHEELAYLTRCATFVFEFTKLIDTHKSGSTLEITEQEWHSFFNDPGTYLICVVCFNMFN